MQAPKGCLGFDPQPDFSGVGHLVAGYKIIPIPAD
jgi:hypothetical protein